MSDQKMIDGYRAKADRTTIGLNEVPRYLEKARKWHSHQRKEIQ